jgi:hypothetical protein
MPPNRAIASSRASERIVPLSLTTLPSHVIFAVYSVGVSAGMVKYPIWKSIWHQHTQKQKALHIAGPMKFCDR